jgi:SET domain-containing protein
MALIKSVPDSQPFEIRNSQIHGLGAYAVRPIRKGARVGEYVGERISSAEGDRRYDDDAMPQHHTFLFTVTSRTVIDAAVGGNDTRFINHSCAPNCEAVIEDGRVFIDALRAIPAGSELFYDYAYERAKDSGPEDDARYPCRCGTPDCRGTILAPPARRQRRRSSRRTVARAPSLKRKASARR